MVSKRRPKSDCIQPEGKFLGFYEAPILAAFKRNYSFVAKDVKRNPLPTVGRSDLDDALASIRHKAGDTLAKAVAGRIREPPRISRQFMPASID